MKKTIIQTTAVIALATVLIFSCKKKTDPAPAANPATTTTGGTTTGGGVLSYNDGTSVTVDSAQAILYTTNAGSAIHRHIDVYGFKAGKQVVEFHFLPKTGAQTVAQNFDSAWLTYYTNNGATTGDNYNSTSGSFNLTTCDTIGNKLIGTFNFVGNNGSVNKTISNGTINIIKIKKN